MKNNNQPQNNPNYNKLYYNINLTNLLYTFFFLASGVTCVLIFSSHFTPLRLTLQPNTSTASDDRRAQPLPPPPPPPLPVKNRIRPSRMHNMRDEELLRRASSMRRENGDEGVSPKVAFMFLTRGAVTLAPLWDKFFEGNDEGFYSIYVHSDPLYDESEFDEGSVFYGTRIPSKKVKWGDINMIEAERRLLANALLDSLNQRFVLLSESCIPLFNFPTIYSYLINSTMNFVQVYDLPGHTGRGRYRRRMSPIIELRQWRKGSQWFEINRDLAIEVVSDRTYFPVFQRYCKGSCIADEHYLPTFVNIKFGHRNSNHSLTWVDWSHGGWHPTRFMRNHVTVSFLESLRRSRKCRYYNVHNETSNDVCYLFARKFTPHSLDRLVRFAPKIMMFDQKLRI